MNILRWCGLVLAALLLAAAARATPAVPDVEEEREQRIKAAFVYNFARFVEWPVDSFEDSRSPFVLGVLGQDRFVTALALLQGKEVHGREVQVRRFETLAGINRCQVVIIGSLDAAEVAAVLAALEGASVLTVGDMQGFADQGGVINFILRKNKIRFQVNSGAATRAGLRISSHLLKLAEMVEGSLPSAEK